MLTIGILWGVLWGLTLSGNFFLYCSTWTKELMTPWMTFWLGFSPQRSLWGTRKRSLGRIFVTSRSKYTHSICITENQTYSSGAVWLTYFLISFSNIRIRTSWRGSIISFLHMSSASYRDHWQDGMWQWCKQISEVIDGHWNYGTIMLSGHSINTKII